jgi:hypothetical protein
LALQEAGAQDDTRDDRAVKGGPVRSGHSVGWSRRSSDELSSHDYEWSDALFLAIVGSVFAAIAIVLFFMGSVA